MRLGGALLTGIALVPGVAFAQGPAPIAIAVGAPGDGSYRIGQELVSRLGADRAAEGVPVELWESLAPHQRILVLLEEVQIAVVPAGEPVPERVRDAVGTVLDAGAGYQVLVAANLDRELVEEVRRATRAGATEETVVASAPPVALVPPRGKRFTVYFGFDEAKLDPAQIGTVAAACNYAATLPAASFVLAGHADRVGPEAYNDALSLSRAQSVAATIRTDERFRDALDVVEFGERAPAVPTADGVREPMNRRVVITVAPGRTPVPAAGPAAGG